METQRTYNVWQGLLGASIDYAGTFPPAALPLVDALREAANFRRTGTHPWLLSKAVLPLSVIKGLKTKDLIEAGSNGEPWLYAALGSPVEADSDFSRTVEWDLREIQRCNDRGADAPVRQVIVSYETKAPAEFWQGAGEGTLFGRVAPVLTSFEERLGRGFCFFLEVPWGEGWDTRVEAAAGAMARWVAESSGGLPVGLKFRTGGQYLPTPRELGSAISVCTRYGLRFKATQGLHHALSGDGHFGFVNVWAALAFSRALGDEIFPVAQLEKLLQETDPKAFRAIDTALAWQDFSLELSDLEMARRAHGATFGSCSLEEPDSELRELI